MTTSTEPKKWTGAKSTISQLRELVAGLPTNAEKEELAALLDTIIKFLTDLRANVSLLPTSEQLADVDTALSRLDELLLKAGASRILAPSVGVRPRPTPPSNATSADLEIAKKKLEELRSLPVDDIRSKLASEDLYSLSELRAIAVVANVRRTDRMPRDAIAHQVAMRIANSRGYEGLSADDHSVEGSDEPRPAKEQ